MTTKKTLSGNILITGGTGTLGRAILRTARSEGWSARFTVYSRDEVKQSQLRALFPEIRTILGDVRDRDRLGVAFAGHDIVIHAAAMKRIPEAEEQTSECVATNVNGSANVILAAMAAGVRRCVGISTDKAVQAINAYGASKLLMEKMFQSAPKSPTHFTVCRYGNVVASRGSVIPIWRKLAAAGKPLTITDGRMTRFWMSESDAVSLVVEALHCDPGTVLIPKMKSLTLREMAELVAPGAPLTEIGLRPGEKIHEMLVHSDEAPYCSNGKPGLLQLSPATGPKTGTVPPGFRYTSDLAPHLDAPAFLAMVDEAEASPELGTNV
jgi:UDP-N-acetylglucosamine 4,6-dehydratase